MNSKANLFLKSTLLVLACALVSVSRASAQDQFDPQETLSINTRLVNVTVSATDAKSRPQTLDGAGLQLYADGVRQEVAYVHTQNSPSSVILLVDISGSMRGPFAQETRFLVKKFLKASDERNRYTLFVFAQGIHLVGTFDGDPEGQRALLKALERQKYGGGTALYHSARRTLKEVLAAKPSMRTALVIFTDGMDTYAQTGKELADDLNSFGGFTCAFVIGQSSDFDLLESIAHPVPASYTREIAERLKKAIGGEAFVARGLDRDIEKTAMRVAELMRSSVEIGFYPQGQAALPGSHDIRVAASGTPELSLKSRLHYVIEK